VILKQLTIENYKAFREAIFHPERDLTIVVGTNGAGKTSLIEVVGLLSEARTLPRFCLIGKMTLVRSIDGIS
jgi:recombinational DNA repair ATPase RecF